jgi:hypothetical protein
VAADVVHNYAYLVPAVNSAGQRSAGSSRVGEFSCAIIAGTP